MSRNETSKRPLATILALGVLCNGGATATAQTYSQARGPGHLVFSQSADQQRERKQPISAEARTQARRAIAAVGLVLVRNSGEPLNQELRPRGSAVIVRKDGLAVTNYHVIANDESDRLYDEIFVRLTLDGVFGLAAARRYRLKPLLVDKDYDLALMRVTSDSLGQPVPESTVFPAVELGDSRSVQLLDDLIVIGFPEKGGSTVTVNTGMVEGKDTLRNWIKTDARLIHGNSGGAAVNSEGKLIGIPTKVVVDGDSTRSYGAVGFLRPAHLVASMLAQVESGKPAVTGPAGTGEAASPPQVQKGPQSTGPKQAVTVQGIVKSAAGGKPVAGARVGLIPAGSQNVTATNLLAWGGTNADGRFELNRRVEPGRYTLKAKAIGYEAFSRDVEITESAARLVIELTPSP